MPNELRIGCNLVIYRILMSDTSLAGLFLAFFSIMYFVKRNTYVIVRRWVYGLVFWYGLVFFDMLYGLVFWF